MIINKDESKATTDHISCDSKYTFNDTTYNSKQKRNNKKCKCECKNYCECKDNYCWSPVTCVCENSKDLKSVTDTIVTKCDEIIIFTDNLSTKKTNTVTTNVRSTVLTNCQSRKVRNCCIFYTLLLAIILTLIILLISNHYVKQKDII